MYFITSTIFIVTVIIAAGYLFDGIGAYRWASYYKYKKDKISLLDDIKKINGIKEFLEKKGITESDDPDFYLSIIWYKDSEKYKSIFDERSEWVMILISSSVLALSAIEHLLILCYLLCNCKFQCWMLPIASSIVLFVLWHFSAQTGIKRMKAHDVKVVYCINEIVKQESKK
jgi:hypothetical protein